MKLLAYPKMQHALADFARELRLAGYEILLMGDMNAYTRTAIGFDGESAIFGEGLFSVDKRRRSQCKQQRLNSNGRALLSLCEQAELTILNDLERLYNDFQWTGSTVGEARENISEAHRYFWSD